MKKFNNKLTAVLVLSIAAVLAGCTQTSTSSQPGSSSQQPSSSASSAPEVVTKEVEVYNGEAVTINFYHTMGEKLREVLDATLIRFNDMYPNIKVNHSQVGSYNDVRDQIKTEISVGAQPNLAYCYPDHVALYNQAKAVRTLDDFIVSTKDQPTYETDATLRTTSKFGLTAEQEADYIEGYYNEGTAFGDGYMYTLPFSKSTEVLYYNKTFFDANNLTVPTTWDEVEAVARQIKAIEPASIPLGYDSESNWFITMAEQYGNPYTAAAKKVDDRFLFDNDGNKAFVKEFASWYKEGLVTTQKLYGNYTSGLFTNVTPDEQGNLIRCLMCIGSTGGASHQRPAKGDDGKYPFEVGIAPMPQVDKANPKAISQGPSVVMFKSTAQEEAASWLLLEFLTTDLSFQAGFSQVSGYMPVINSALENDAFKAYLAAADGGDNITALSTKVAFEQSEAYYVSPAFIGSSEARDQVGNIITGAMTAAASAGGLTDAKLNDIFAEAIDECIYNTK